VLLCVAVCCYVLQCVAVCCSVLQYVAVCCSELQSLGLLLAKSFARNGSYIIKVMSFTGCPRFNQ